jgi:class 3 adenylate cyclase
MLPDGERPDVRAAVALASDEAHALEAYLRSKRTAVLAILFSDIEGWTRMTEERGEAYAAQVRKFFRAQTVEIAQRDGAGWVVKDLGDSFLCVFAEPSTAVARALEMQEVFREFRPERDEKDEERSAKDEREEAKDEGQRPISDGGLRRAQPSRFRIADSGSKAQGLRVRIGIHMGQVSVEESLQLDVFGRHVNRAARVTSLAGGGQVYVTRPVYDSAQGWLKDWEARGLRWANHGSYRLKGIDEPMEIFEATDTRIAAPRSPAGASRAGTLAGAGAQSAPASRTMRCAACGREYASRMSLVAACEVCGAPICQTCVRVARASRCAEHK